MGIFTVDSTADRFGDTGTGATINGAHSGTLRQAINYANLHAGTTIDFQAGLGTITLDGNMPLIYADKTIIDGSTAGAGGVTINGAGQFRPFFVSGLPSSPTGETPQTISATIASITVQNALAQGGAGGDYAGGGLGAGGALFVNQNATVTLRDDVFLKNTVAGGMGGGYTLTGNGAGGGGGLGGNGGIDSSGGGGGLFYPGGVNFGGGGGITSAGGSNSSMGGAGINGTGGGGDGSFNGAGHDGGFGGGGGGGYSIGADPKSIDAGNGGFGGGGGGPLGNGGFGGGGGFALFDPSRTGGLDGKGGYAGFGGFGGGGGGGSGGVGGGFGGGEGLGSGGGGGAMGGAIFVASGGALEIDGTLSEMGGSATGGRAGAGATSGGVLLQGTGGIGYGSGIFYQGVPGTTSMLTVGGTGGQSIGDSIADYIGSGGQNPNSGGNANDQGGSLAIAKTGTGLLTLSGANTFSGGTTIKAGEIVLDHVTTLNNDNSIASAAAGKGAIHFAAAAGASVTLTLAAGADPGDNGHFANTVDGLGKGEFLDLAALAYAAGATATVAGSTLTVTSGGTTETFSLSNAGSTTFAAVSDGSGGTLVGTGTVGQVSVTAGATYSGSNDRDVALIDYGATVNANYVATTKIVNGHVEVTLDNGTFSQTVDLGTGKQAVGLDFSTNRAAVTLTGGAYGDSLKGGAGADIIDGGRGIDTMAGGAGRDTYIVRDSGDAIIEASNGGTDSVKATVSYTLDTNVERLFLAGTGNIDGTGNAAANYVVGNSGDNHIDGGGGRDILTGDGGSDTFVFKTALGPSNVDRITDFAVSNGQVELHDSIFAALNTGSDHALAASGFASVTAGQKYGADVHIVYREDKGALYYDVDGYGGQGAVLFAVLDDKPSLTAASFTVHHDIL